MPTFRTRLARAARERGPVILANDYDDARSLESRTLKNIERLHPHICAIKLNFHLLLPLGRREIRNITRAAHRRGLEAIADIKLNDIGNTNRVTAGRLWEMGFDAVIANPVMGPDALKNLARSAHREGMGVITLCHMSAPEARISYELRLQARKRRLYRLFLDWALGSGADGIVVGATYPDIIKECSRRAGSRLEIFSPGVGTQGGDARQTRESGSDYLIVGRSILGARDPASAARRLSAA